MSPLSNSVYSSAFTYNSYVLTRPYPYLITKALIQLQYITCFSLAISILIVRFGDQAHACRADTPMSHQKRTCQPLTKVSWLFDELSDNNASDDGLFLPVNVRSS